MRSVKNKDQIPIQELNNKNINVALIAETWIKDTLEDLAWLNQSELCQGSYETSTHNRLGERSGDGIVLILVRNNNIKLLENGNTPTTEYAIWRYTIRNKPIHIFGIYHPPPNWEHNTTNGIFIDNITELLVNKLPQHQNRIILRYFKIHIEDLTDVDVVIFNDTIKALGLAKHISCPTHVEGNALDLIFIQICNCFDIINITLHAFISDHCMVSVNISINKQKYPIETKKIRDRTKATGPSLLKTSHPQNSIKTQPLIKPAVNLIWNCSKYLMQMHPYIKFNNRPEHSSEHKGE